jgi:hypothetical protein
MAGRLHDSGALAVRVPRGIDGYWAIIRELAKTKGEFTVADVDDESNTDIASVKRYVRALERGGFLAVARVERRTAGRPRHIYRLQKDQADAPRFRANGELIEASDQQQLWNAIRTLKTFTLPELLLPASTPIRTLWARRYLTMLHCAGYLVQLQTAAGKHRPATWRLKPGMDTGPKPPERRRITTVALWDPNVKKFIGQPPVVSGDLT